MNAITKMVPMMICVAMTATGCLAEVPESDVDEIDRVAQELETDIDDREIEDVDAIHAQQEDESMLEPLDVGELDRVADYALLRQAWPIAAEHDREEEQLTRVDLD